MFQRSHPTVVQDLFSDLRDGTRLLDLLEVMSGQRMVSAEYHQHTPEIHRDSTKKVFVYTESLKCLKMLLTVEFVCFSVEARAGSWCVSAERQHRDRFELLEE